MYVESPLKTVMCPPISFLGGGHYNGCKEQPGLYTSTMQTEMDVSYVYSWRGPKDMTQPRIFNRKKFECLTGTVAPVFTCSPRGYTDGSLDWGLFTSCHYYMNPLVPWGLDFFEGQANHNEMETYREYMVQELYAKANSPTIQLAVMLAESTEALTYLRKRLGDALALYRRFKALAAELKNPASLWLEWRYAILPLMLDAQTIMEYLSGEVRKKEKVQNGFKDKRVAISDHTFTFSNTGDSIQYVFRNKTKTTFRGGSALWIRSQRDENKLGLGLHDWIQAGWEKVPLSFIVDWFFDVGSWLSSLRDTAIISDRSYATVVKEVEGEISLHRETGCSVIKAIGRNGTSPIRYKGYWISRSVDVHPPSIPIFVPTKLKWVRQLDAAALITSYFKRR